MERSPAKVLTDYIEKEIGLDKAEVANRLGMSRQNLYNIMNGSNKIGTKIALKLERLTDVPAIYWATLQMVWDLQEGRKLYAKQLNRIEPLKTGDNNVQEENLKETKPVS